MALFHSGKKKKEKKVLACCCSAPQTEMTASCRCGAPVKDICSIKVLGAGCKSCHEQYAYVKKAVGNLELGVEVEYVTDMERIMEYGVMSMPAIVVNDKVLAFGKVLKTAEVEKLLKV